MENDGYPDDKYNLEVKVDLNVNGCGGFHCWRCGDTHNTKGSLITLFKKYAPADIYKEFKECVIDYRQSMKYKLTEIDNIENDITEIEELRLPDGFLSLQSDDEKAKEALIYLQGRGIDQAIIERYHIGYIDNNSKDRTLRKRVYIPSYDSIGNLTYWVGRDYTGKNKQKMKNPLTPKTQIIFNEGLINNYEPITLVEGPFDHIVVPNSIPLLGKVLTEDSAVFKFLLHRAKCGVNIFLDDDAKKDAVKIYKTLDNTSLRGTIKIIIADEGYDPSLIFQERGYRGIINALRSAKKIEEKDILFE